MKMRKLTRREKILLVILAIVGLASFSIDQYARAKAEEVKQLWALLQAEIRMMHPIREPGNGVTSSFHDGIYKDGVFVKNYEDSWIDDVDPDKNLVLVRTMNTKMRIVFRTSSEHLKRIHIGSIAPVTFECMKLNNGSCDFTKPHTLYVSNQKVEIVDIIERSS